MKYMSLILTGLLLCANAAAAININNQPARNMDDVHSLGVIYINHNVATEDDVRQAPEQAADAQSAKYDPLTREADSG